MPKKAIQIIITVILLVNLVVSCVGTDATPTRALPSLSPTRTPSPSRTWRPTATPSLSRTPTNTPTATPIPEVFLDNSINPEQFSPSGVFIVNFLTPMNAASSTSPVMVFPYTEGTFVWNSSNTTLAFQPKQPLEIGQTYTLFLDSALRTAAGSGLGQIFEWQIQVDRGPEVVSSMPATGLLETRKPQIEITFDRPMEQGVTGSAFSIQPTLAYEITWSGNKVARIQITEPMQPGVRYDFQFAGAGSSPSATDTNGIALQADYVVSYWVSSLDISVTSTGPNIVEVSFNYKITSMPPASLFTIEPTLSGNWSWPTTKTARFEATEPIPFAKQYKLGISNLLSDADGALQSNLSSYTFMSPPPLSIKIPGEESTYSDQVTYRNTLSPISIAFDVPVDHETAENAFRISPDMPGTFAWKDAPGTTGQEVLEFYPARLFEMGTTYTVALLPSVRDTQNQPLLLEPNEIEFTTIDDNYYSFYFSSVSFGYGSNAQIVRADGPRLIQFGAEAGARIEFDLYKLDTESFLNLYANDHGSRSDWDESMFLPVPGEGMTPSAAWEYTGSTDQTVDETSIPAEAEAGTYILNLSIDGRLYDQLYIILTHNLIMAKLSGHELFVWLKGFDGIGIANAEILVYSDQGDVIYRGYTNVRGSLNASLPEDANPMLVLARKPSSDGYEVTISGLDRAWRTVRSFTSDNWRNWWLRAGDPRNFKVYPYTDRPIYLPGQTVNYKVVIRRDRDVSYSLLPVGSPVTVNIRDGRKNVLESTELFMDHYGTVDGSFKLAEGVSLGVYTIEVVVGEESTTQTFKVEEYRKPDFEVSIQPEDPAQTNKYIVGADVALKINANYFFGEPVVNGKITTNVYYLAPGYFPRWNGDPQVISYTWFDTSTISVSHGDLGTDGTGKAHLNIGNIPDYESTWDWYSGTVTGMYALEVTVDDGSNQVVAGTYIFQVYSAGEKIVVNNGGYFQRPDQPFSIRVAVTDLENEPIEGRQLELSVRAWDRSDYDFGPATQTNTLQTDAHGLAQQEVALPSGYYEIEVSGEDTGGRTILDTTYVFVFSSTDDWWNRTRQELAIVAEQDSYRPNETARFMVESSFSGPALLTFERGHVIHSIPVELTAPLTIVETRLLPEFAPNVFVTINAWQESETVEVSEYDYDYWGSNHPEAYLRMATLELQVDSRAKALTVNITTDRANYSPGGKMQVTIDVRDQNGFPVSAEVSLSVVDEAIFSLTEELSQEIHYAFYGPRPLTVRTYDSLAPDRFFVGPAGQGGGGPPGPVEPPRSDFEDTAAWFPALLTGSDGKVTVTVELPDNLTSWRLTARAVTQNSLVGQNHTNVETRQDLIIRPMLPRSLTTSDQVNLLAMVHNNGDAPCTVAISLAAEGLGLLDEATKSVTVEANQVMPVIWSVSVLGLDDTEISFNAMADNGATDAVSLILPIQPAVVTDLRTRSGEFTGNLRLSLTVPPTVPETSQVTLELYRSQRGTILSGLEFLTGFPYGCVEQTMSRALPNAVIGRVGNLLGDPGLQARTAPLIQESIYRLYGFQHNDGGWGWWYDDQSNDYQTAWVLFGLSQISQAGFDIDPGVIDRAVEYLDDGMDDMDIRTRAYALYSMALNDRGDAEASLDLADSLLNELDPFSQAALALTLHKLGEIERAQAILESLGARASRNGRLVYWSQPDNDGEYSRKTMASSLRTTALVLDAYLTMEPDNVMIPGIVEYILEQREGNRGWGTTNETTFAILALTDYVLLQNQTVGNSNYVVEWNGVLTQSGRIGPGRMSVVIDLPVGNIPSGTNTLTITTSGNSLTYYNLTEQYGLPGNQFPSAGAISITRSYYDPATNKPIDSITTGQLVEVRLKVVVKDDLSYVIVEDRLPGGFEALNENLNTTPHIDAPDEYDYYSRFSWESLGYNYKQIHADRVSFFITDLSVGSHVFKYIARAVLSGEFLALPAEISAMYDLETWGRSRSDWIIIH